MVTSRSSSRSTWAARYRASVLSEGRQKVMDKVVPKTQEILDNYVRGRRGELKYTEILWGRVALAFGLAGLLIAAVVLIHKCFS